MRLLSTLAIAVTGLVLFAACNSTDNLPGTNSRSSSATSVPTPADGIRRITVTELQSMVNRNEVFIVDVRGEDAYKAGHIRGAKLIPVGDTEKRLGELPKDKLIVTYCA